MRFFLHSDFISDKVPVTDRSHPVRAARGHRYRWLGALLALAGVTAGACHYDSFSPSVPVFGPYTIHQLGLLSGGTASQAYAGAASIIVGYATDAGGKRRAVTFAGGAATRLPEPSGATTSQARSVNTSGTIAGFATVSGQQEALVWPSATTAPVVLPGLGGTYQSARAINAVGAILGTAQTDSGDTVLVLWQPGDSGYAVARLDSADTAQSGGGFEAAALNALGQAAGNNPDGDTGFLWNPGGGFEEVDAPNNGSNVDVNGFNNFGVIVGDFTTASGTQVLGLLYTGAQGSLPLGAPPAPYTNVAGSAVTDSGAIIGYAFTSSASGSDSTAAVVVGSIIDTADVWTVLPTLGGTLAEPSDNGVTPCGVILGYALLPNNANRQAAAWVPPGCTIP